MKYITKIIITILVTAALMVGAGFVFSAITQTVVSQRSQNVNKSTAEVLATTVLDEMTDDSGNTVKARTEENYSEIVTELSMYEFESVAILSPDGEVIASTDESMMSGGKKAFISWLGSTLKTPDKVTEAFKNCEVVVQRTSEGERQYYFADIEYKGASAADKILCVLPESATAQTQTSTLLVSIIEIIAFLVLLTLCMLLCRKFYLDRYKALYKVKNVDSYFFVMSRALKVKYIDEKFAAEFDKDKIKETVESSLFHFEDKVTSSEPIRLAIEDKQGNPRVLMFSPAAGIGEYRLVGSDATVMAHEYEALLEEHNTDPTTGLHNGEVFLPVWNKYVKTEDYNGGMIVAFGLPSANYYRMLFGEQVFDSGLKVAIKKVADDLKDYGIMYKVNGQVILFVKDRNTREAFIKNINKISEKISSFIEFEQHVIKPDVRMGAVVLDSLKEDTPLDSVINMAFRALNNASTSAAQTYYVLRTNVFKSGTFDITTRKGMMQLLSSGNIDVWYQPQIDLKTDKVKGVEALIRIIGGNEMGLHNQEFVEAAEKNGCIVELGEFIYKRAMDYAKILQDFKVSIAINISPIQLMQMGFIEKFLTEFRARGLKPGSVHIEIIEGTMMYSMQEVILKLEILRKNGIDAEIDDFGIAYSSMLYLEKLPVRTIKIDKAFIDGIVDSETDRALVKNIINIARDLKLECIAEGVEKAEQVEILKELGCDMIQGYYYAKSMPREKVYEYVKERNNGKK